MINVSVIHKISKTTKMKKKSTLNIVPNREKVIVFLFVGLTTMGTSMNFIGCFITLSVQTFQLLIVIYRRSNFVYHYRGCKSIYQPLSYPLKV